MAEEPKKTPKTELSEKLDLHRFGTVFRWQLTIETYNGGEGSPALLQAGEQILKENNIPDQRKLIGTWIKETSINISSEVTDLSQFGMALVSRDAFDIKISPEVIESKKKGLLREYKIEMALANHEEKIKC